MYVATEIQAVEQERSTPSLAAVMALAARLVPGRKHNRLKDTSRDSGWRLKPVAEPFGLNDAELRRWSPCQQTNSVLLLVPSAPAQIVLKADADGLNWTDARIAEAFHCQVQTIENLR